MNTKKVIPIYDCKELYLYEIIEDYKDAKSQEEREEIFCSFCSLLWSCNNKRRTYTKTIHFHIKKDLRETELGKVFDAWTDVEYESYKTMTKDENWCSIIRQKINNIYTRYFDSNIILANEYMELIKTPKRLYYEWLSGIDMDAATVTEIIDDAIDRSEKLKKRLKMQKMDLSWTAYKKVIEDFLHRCFDNSKRIEEYESQTSLPGRLDFLTEDHLYISYINKCLEGEILKWQKKYYSLRRGRNIQYKRCKLCQRLIERTGNKKMYCTECASIQKKQANRISNRAYYKRKRENRIS